MATAEKKKRGLFSFYRSKFKSKERPSAPVTEEACTATPARKSYCCGEDPNSLSSPAVTLARVSDFYGEEKIKALVTMSPITFPRNSICDEERGRRRTAAVEGPRKSVSQVEANMATAVALLQVKVLMTDMPGSMQLQAFRCARRSYDSLDSLSAKFIAYNMKKEFDKVYGTAWHCVVGSSFGSFVTHSTGCFLYFSMEKLHILLFKTKVQRKVT